MRFLYTLFLWLLCPFILLRLWQRSRKQPEYLQHVAERFGRYRTNSTRPIIWIHAVSVGETRATQSLVKQLLQRYPNHQILLTHTTPTGRATSEQLYGEQILRVYLPYDYPFAVQSFLQHFRPKLGVLMETEIWVNLIHRCQQQHIPILLLNARMSEKSARGYSRFAKLTKLALSELSAIAAQTESDALRLQQLGAPKVSIMGNLKFDISPPSEMLARAQQLRALFGRERKVVLFASTRDGEEELLLNAATKLNTEQLLIVIVPRHPQRFDEVAKLIQQYGFSYQRRSANEAIITQMVLGDSMGEMFAYYAAADLAFIGGSLLPFGGQNLIEACAVNTPVIFGPHMFNFADASQQALQAGAAQQVSDTAELVLTIQQLFNNPQQLAQMKQCCGEFVAKNQGATNLALQLIQDYTAMPLSSNMPSNKTVLK